MMKKKEKKQKKREHTKRLSTFNMPSFASLISAIFQHPLPHFSIRCFILHPQPSCGEIRACALASPRRLDSQPLHQPTLGR